MAADVYVRDLPSGIESGFNCLPQNTCLNL